MATEVVAIAETAVAVENETLARLPEAYATNHDRAERAVPLQDMQSLPGMRNRTQQSQTARVAPENRSSPETSQALTSSSPEDNEDNQVPYQRVEVTATGWRRLWRILSAAVPSRRTKEELAEFNHHQGYDKLKFDKVEDFPEGYPQLAAFLNSNDNFAVFRRFGNLSARTLVQLQVDLTELEKELHDLDNADASNPAMKHRLRGFERFEGSDSTQKDLISKIRKKLGEYFELLLQDAQLRALGQPPPRHHLALFHWMWNNKPLGEGKDSFVLHTEDFISASNHAMKGSRLKDFIETYFYIWPESRIKRFLQTERELEKSRDPLVEHYAPEKLSILIKAISVSLAVAILLIPVFFLFLVPMSRESMAWLVFGFVFAFSTIMSVVTEARSQDVLIGTAAYGAVLITFLGNMGGNGAGISPA